MTRKRRGGPRPKAPGGLDRVLFVRCTQALLDQLDALADIERASGRAVSRSDVARELLFKALAQRT